MAESEQFDPYRKWLGIPPKDQPPNHYRILGIELFENDPDVIESASDARMAHLRTFQTGKRSDLSQRLLNEIAAAKTCLLNPEKKDEYDAHLQAARQQAQRTPTPIPVRAKPPPPAPPTPRKAATADDAADARTPGRDSPGFVAVGTRSSASVSTARGRARRKKKSNALPIAMIVGGLAAVAVLVGLAAMLSGPEGGVAGNGSGSRTGAADDSFAFDGVPADDPHSTTDAPRPFDVDGPGDGELPNVNTREPAVEPIVEPIVEPDEFAPPTTQEPGPEDSVGEGPAAVARLPRPSAEKLAAAKKLLGDVYRDALAQAKTSADKIALADKLLQDGRAIDDDPVSSFALFDVAQTLAAQQGAVAVSLEAIGELTGRFEVDGLPLMIAAVQTGTKAARTGRLRLEAAKAALPVARQAMDAGLYDTAIEILNGAVNTAMRARDKKAADQARELRHRAVALQKAWPEVQAALEKLKQNPDDAAAADLAGRFLVAAKGQWDKGLPLLAQSNDAGVGQTARDDLSGPKDAQAQVELAGRWMKIAETAGDVHRDAFKARAYHWYGAALPGLKGLARTRVEQILQESPESQAGPADPSAVAGIEGFDVRKLEHREAMLAVHGGDEKTEAAVTAALEWLAMHQNPDGSWSFDHQGNKCRARCANPGKIKSNIAATGVALMPFLGAGFDHRAGKHKGLVSRGIALLGRGIRSGAAGASLADGGEEMFAHAFGTIAVCEAYGMTADKRLEPYARGLVGFIDVVQDPEQGGWARIPRDTGDDVRRFIWQINALHAAKLARLEVPNKIGQQAMRFLDVMQVGGDVAADAGDKDKGKGKDDVAPGATVGTPGAAYYLRIREEQPTGQCDRSTAIGLLGRIHLGWKRDNPALVEGVAAIARRGPSETDIYYDFFATELMFHLGGPAWHKWNVQMKQILLDAQATEGHEAGSWYFEDATADAADRGRLFSTALAAMILETYYRQPPLFEPPKPSDTDTETDTPAAETAEPETDDAPKEPAVDNGFDVRGFLEEE